MATAAVGTAIDVEDAQGLVASGYGHLPQARYLLARITDSAGALEWLGALADTIATARGRSDGTAVNVAFTATGLTALGLPETVLDGFSLQFREGMTTPHRRRVLGDHGANAPEEWIWGGPASARVDVLLALYAANEHELGALTVRAVAGMDAAGLEVREPLDTTYSSHEHFGFRDGIAQPVLEGLRSGHPRDTIKPGELLLGYRNEYGLHTDRPLVDPADDPTDLLPADPEGSGRNDLGRNGTYLVFRQLHQDVPAFWSFLDGLDGDRDALAAKIVGRWPSGAPLVLSPDRDDPAHAGADDFDYHEADPDGLRCPLGAHVRRAHPRDSLDPDPGTERSLAIDKHHRLLRRGRAYGEPITQAAALAAASDGADPGERGLHFICLCANLARQFEFVQHTWCNNPKFSGLYDDADPLIGSGPRTFTVQADPARRRIRALPDFVRVRGGAYFFLPGIRALRYLAGS